MNKLLKETALFFIMAIPYVYLAIIWNNLPEQVPTHFNLHGDADNWSAKSALFFMPAGLSIVIYLVMLIIPLLDPKKKIEQMGNKYYTLRLVLTVFIVLLSTYLLYAIEAGSLKNPNVLIALIGGMFAVLGNYFQAMRPNYFMGIRTPWTLESDEVWKKTHLLGGRLWMAGGILSIILAFLISNMLALTIIFGAIITVLVIVPVAYSYTEFKKEKNRKTLV